MARVLLVEDDDLTRELFVKVLSRIGGFDVETTEDPEEIMALAGDGKVDAVLMDVSLNQSWLGGEEMDGVALTRILKADPATRHLPVLLVSAFEACSGDANMVEESGADGYIAKPVTDFQAMVDKVNSVLVK